VVPYNNENSNGDELTTVNISLPHTSIVAGINAFVVVIANANAY